MSTARRIDVTDCAKLIRKALKRHFPGVKFSVRSDRYSGGSSVDVNWTDGPMERDVDAVVKVYQGASFDGMTDSMEYHRDLVSNEDGSFEEVRYGADFVQCQRQMSPEMRKHLVGKLVAFHNELCDVYGAEPLPEDADPFVRDFVLRVNVVPASVSEHGEAYLSWCSHESQYASILVGQMFHGMDARQVSVN